MYVRQLLCVHVDICHGVREENYLNHYKVLLLARTTLSQTTRWPWRGLLNLTKHDPPAKMGVIRHKCFNDE